MTNGTELAKDRTDRANDRRLLANERTFAGWIRTGMAWIGGRGNPRHGGVADLPGRAQTGLGHCGPPQPARGQGSTHPTRDPGEHRSVARGIGDRGHSLVALVDLGARAS
ncbi:DUF202 domain-containing protein [Sulfitobacter sabulilitoris]|uniref:DUF202 domain-containing protein n=1 Tax=Sulfitobacter sabulilitoris TaxID=2562655 RepID=UPI00319DA911